MFEPLVPADGAVWEGCRTLGGGDVLEEVGYWWPPAAATMDPHYHNGPYSLDNRSGNNPFSIKLLWSGMLSQQYVKCLCQKHIKNVTLF